MLSLEQLTELRAAHEVIEILEDQIDLDDPRQLEIEVDPGELDAILRTWSFMFEALRSTGYLSSVRIPADQVSRPHQQTTAKTPTRRNK